MRSEPQIRATVITIRTTLQPSNRTFIHEVVIADGRARSMNEIDSWRLIDLNQNTVTFVDDITRSYRRESIRSLVGRRRAALASSLPDEIPRAQFISTGAKREMQGVTAVQSLIRSGAYQRELWVANHPAIPSNLYAALYATEPVSSPIAAMMKDVDEAMLNMRGFPLADHAELPFGKTKMIVDRTVLRIDQRNVPQSWLNVREGYRGIKEPGEGRRPASLLPDGQKTREAVSRFFGRARKTP